MDKDKIGLIKYLVIMMLISLLPLMELYILGFIFMSSRVLNYDIDIPKIFIFLFVCLVIIPIIYILSIILITRFAIIKHWSRYLDKFFNNKKWNTVIFIICILIIYFHFISNSLFWGYLLFCIVPTYIIVYLTNLFYIFKLTR